MTDVIRRKIDRARPTLAEGAPGADRGWRLALARATRDAMGLDLDFRKLTITRLSLAEILDIAPERALLALLDGPAGGLGVIMLSPPVTSALIEMQTVGRLSTAPAAPRRPSRIDAAMVAGVIDRALSGLDEALADEADLVWAGGFRYASYLEDARPLALMLEEDVYRVLTAEVALGGGTGGGPGGRDGTVILVLPAEGRGERPALATDPTDATAPQFTAALQAQVMQSDCRLDAVVGRLTLPLRQIMALEVGETLILPSAALDAIALETLDGRRVAQARLGQHRGMRALKLSEAVQTASPPQAPPRPAPVPDGEPPSELRAAG
ncbi:flagellar motor switch protein FliM [Tabrizicola thermarum]|uniref:flagellar motor switch protein FliM n=1 Tax=Tabrizicola thermarum TaxID=2670345 RepID=UPI000FFB5AF1|nr:flagellar motor switch protein FliM [Tabrizicola thermarum]